MGRDGRAAAPVYDGGRGAAAVAGRIDMKRAFDMALSGAGLLAPSPLWALFAAAIKLEDGGPIFYTQERVGFGGRTSRR